MCKSQNEYGDDVIEDKCNSTSQKVFSELLTDFFLYENSIAKFF